MKEEATTKGTSLHPPPSTWRSPYDTPKSWGHASPNPSLRDARWSPSPRTLLGVGGGGRSSELSSLCAVDSAASCVSACTVMKLNPDGISLDLVAVNMYASDFA